jgi:Cu+-exporting ATPase
VLALDKTGTLTCGQPQVTDTEVRGLTSAEALHLAAALEHNSEHPLARAIVAAHGDAVLGAVSGFKAVAGMGVEGVVDGRTLRLGSPVWLGLQDDAVVAAGNRLEKQLWRWPRGRTLALLPWPMPCGRPRRQPWPGCVSGVSGWSC